MLFGLVVALFYFRPGVTVHPLPASVPQYTALWGSFVPANAQLFGFENYTMIRQYNSSYPTQFSTLLNITNPAVALTSKPILSVLDVDFAKPNASVALAFVSDGAFSNFTTAFQKVSSFGVQVGSDTMFGVQNLPEGQTTPQTGWLALIPAYKAVAFSIGGVDANTALKLCLQVQPSNSMISKLNVRQMLYIANGTENHLAIGIQAFPGVIPAGNSTMTVIDDSGSQVVVNRIIEFGNPSAALSNYDVIRTDYNAAGARYAVFDSYVNAAEYFPQADVSGVVRLVE